jgi:hypothetical protein
MRVPKQNLPLVNHDDFWGFLFHWIFNFWVGSSTSFKPKGRWLRFFPFLFVLMHLSYVNFLKLCPIDVEREFSLLSLDVVTLVLGSWCKLSYENEIMLRESPKTQAHCHKCERMQRRESKAIPNNKHFESYNVVEILKLWDKSACSKVVQIELPICHCKGLET